MTRAISAVIIAFSLVVALPTVPTSQAADSSITIDVSIATGTDDAEQRSSGSVTVTSSDLELVEEAGKTQVVGMRFAGLGIPPGATINMATLQFTVDEVSIDPASLTIRTEAADNPSPFTTGSLDISSRATSVTAIAWNPAPWPTVGESGNAGPVAVDDMAMNSGTYSGTPAYGDSGAFMP